MSAELKVIPGSGMRALEVTGLLCEEIKDLVYSYAAKYEISVASAVGVLTIAQIEILAEQK